MNLTIYLPGGNLVQTGGSGYDCGVVVGTTFTLFHQLRDQISDARILAKTASVRLKDRLDCGPTNSFSHLVSSDIESMRPIEDIKLNVLFLLYNSSASFTQNYPSKMSAQ